MNIELKHTDFAEWKPTIPMAYTKGVLLKAIIDFLPRPQPDIYFIIDDESGNSYKYRSLQNALDAYNRILNNM